MIYIANGTEFLMHHGVKGQKWGVRRKQYVKKRYDKYLRNAKEADKRIKTLQGMSRGKRLAAAGVGAGLYAGTSALGKQARHTISYKAYKKMGGVKGGKHEMAKVVGAGILGYAAEAPFNIAGTNAIMKTSVSGNKIIKKYNLARAKRLKQKYNNFK